MNVSGILMVGFAGSDGRAAWEGSMLARAASEFEPHTVPLVDGHPAPDGTAAEVGVLTQLHRTGPSLRFEASLDDEEIIERLAAEGRLAISAEYESRTPWLPSPSWLTVERPEGQAAGYPLLAIAVLRPGEQAARAGSWLWSVEEDDDARAMSDDDRPLLTREYQGGKVRRVYEQPALLTRSFGRVTSVR